MNGHHLHLHLFFDPIPSIFIPIHPALLNLIWIQPRSTSSSRSFKVFKVRNFKVSLGTLRGKVALAYTNSHNSVPYYI
jgi:hypothetical protein